VSGAPNSHRRHHMQAFIDILISLFAESASGDGKSEGVGEG
jgi:hypothetical protein